VSLRGVELDASRETWSETEHTVDGSHKLALRRGSSSPKAIFSIREDDRVTIELFDLGRDPRELEPLDPAAAQERLEARLRDYLSGVAVAREGRAETPRVELDPEERERLRSLGYVQ
jgi:hypothetical protein